MDGVTILQVIERSGRSELIEGLIVLIGVIAVIAFIFSIIFIFSGEVKAFIISTIIGIICVAILGVIIRNTEEVTDITYRVLVDNTVNMNEFFQTYELIRTEGLIYVVKLIGT